MRIPESVTLKTLKNVEELLSFLSERSEEWVYATELSHYCKVVADMGTSYPNTRRLALLSKLVESKPIPFGGTARKYKISPAGLAFLRDAETHGHFSAYLRARKRINTGGE